jgi:hypothetical protein
MKAPETYGDVLDTVLLTKLEVFGKELTLREYLLALLLTLWDEQEDFSGKRPFGNSDWAFDVYAALIKAGHLKGTLDSDGAVEDYDEDGGHQLVRLLIARMGAK